MNTERWQQVKHLFEQAYPLDPGERAKLLDARCRDDAALRAEVERLLDHEVAAEGFLEEPALPRDAESPPPQRIGPYRVVREIGRGGMGSVYLARRDDDEFEHEVAIKIIRRGLDGQPAIDRFRQERQILAHLDHPAISRLFDGGTTVEGKPYLVMEYIEGTPIDRYCDDRGLDLDRRLELFGTVCAAVHYAHQNLVVHRDIKPSNVLVTAAGAPKLLDFGTAKLLSAEGEATEVPAGGEVRALTPAYASPEQLRGEPITTASDVYALGLVLYELLAGVTPFPDAARLTPDIVRAVCEDPPPRPSEVVGPDHAARVFPPRGAAARRRLAGDLDAIVLTALRKDPAARYVSVAALAADVRRFRDARPILARRAGVGERIGKLLRRRRGAAVAAALLVVAIAGGLLATLSQARRAIRESRRAELHLERAVARQQEAETERARAEQVSDYLVDLFAVSDPNRTRGNPVTAQEILARGVDRIDGLDAQPAVQAELLATMAQAYSKLLRHERARELFERSLAVREAASPQDVDAIVRDLSRLANSMLSLGDFAAADPVLERALEMARGRFGDDRLAVADILDDLAWSRLEQGRVGEAEGYARETLAIRRNELPAQHEELAESLSLLASVRLAQGDITEAAELAGASLDMYRELFGDEHTGVVMASNNVARVLYAQGDTESAERLLRRALETDRRLVPHPHVERASILDNLGAVLLARGDGEEGLRLHRRALEMRRELLGEHHPSVATSYYNLGQHLAAGGETAAATRQLRRALEIWTETLGAAHPNVLVGQRAVAWHLYGNGEYGAAEPALRRLLELQRALAVGDDREASTLRMLGVTLASLGRPVEGESAVRRALEVRRAALAPGDWRIARAESALAVCLTAQRRFAEAGELLAAAVTTLRAARGEDDPATRAAARRLSELRAAWPRPAAVGRSTLASAAPEGR